MKMTELEIDDSTNVNYVVIRTNAATDLAMKHLSTSNHRNH